MISMAGKAIRRWWALFALPTFAAFIIGFVVPFIMGVYLSFCEFTTVTDGEWAGLKNYGKALQDKEFLHALGFSTAFTIVTTIVINVAAFSIAYMLTKAIKGSNLFRSVRKGGNRQNNKLPVWVAFSYFELGTVTMMYNYLRGDFRKAILAYSFAKTDYAKRDTEVTDTWLDAVRNLRNYCAHNSMLVGMTSSVVLLDSNDDTTLLQADNDLFSRIYALKKLVPTADVDNMKNDIKKLIKETPVDVYLLGILPSNWEEIYDKIVEF